MQASPTENSNKTYENLTIKLSSSSSFFTTNGRRYRLATVQDLNKKCKHEHTIRQSAEWGYQSK